MAPPRKFDHDEARRRYAAGESTSALAAEYGVTFNAVWYVVTEIGAESNKRGTTAYLARNRVPCETCGKPCLSLAITSKAKHNPDGRVLCVGCRGIERRERLLFDEQGTLVAVRCQHLDCANGERWQPPENFTRGQRSREVRDGGIHGACRSCQTRSRRDYRKRHAAEQTAYDRAYGRRRRAAKQAA